MSERQPWTCPRCKAIKAPHVDECRCYPAGAVWSPWATVTIRECQHEYPNPWHGTAPPPCKKCGEPAQQTMTWGGTYSTADTYVIPTSSCGGDPS